jgi:uncharacterized membrane protein
VRPRHQTDASVRPLNFTVRARAGTAVPMNPLLLGVLAMLVFLLVGTFFRERSLRRLDVTQAGTLVLTVRPIRVRFTLVFAGSVLAWLILMYLFPRWKPALFLISLGWLLTLVGIAQWIGWRALRRCALPPEFFRNYGAAAALNFLGYAAFFGALASTSFLHANE